MKDTGAMISRTRTGSVALVSFSILATQCAGQNFGRSWTTEDSWYNPAKSPGAIESELVVIEDEQRYRVLFREVAASKKLRAEQALKSKSCIPLSLKQARFLTNGSYRKARLAPYLVRAVHLNQENGQFTVNQIRGDLFVRHDSLGDAAVPMKRQALIVNLPKAPKNVYVDCHVIK